MIRPLAVVLCLALPAAAMAQPQPPRVGLDKRWPSETADTPAGDSVAPADKPAAKPKPHAPPRVIACSGVFAKDSSHLKLAQFFSSENLTWAKVDGPEGTKLDASVIYPKDATRRLEVLWNNVGGRNDTQLIVVTGKSNWVGPKGLKLGMPLAALEKLNGKPFTMHGFGGENGGRVTDWGGGVLANLAGGCKVGVRLAPDSKATAPSDEVSGEKDVASTVPTLKTAAPKISEIIVGY